MELQKLIARLEFTLNTEVQKMITTLENSLNTDPEIQTLIELEELEDYSFKITPGLIDDQKLFKIITIHKED